jgi:GT2 family glycosyltransferase
MPVIAAVIPALDNHALTKRCVESLLASSGDLEPRIIIVDDGSQQPYDARDFPNAEIVRNETNRGYTHATNRGIARALREQPDAILLTNNDIEFKSHAVARLVQNLGDYDLMGPLTRSVVLPDRFLTSFIEFSCVLIRTSVFRTIGGLDPRFVQGYYSDDDFCVRCQIAGFRLGYLPEAGPWEFVHEAASTHGKARIERIKASFPIFMEKWGESEIPAVRDYIRNYLWNPNAPGQGKIGA